MDIFGRHDIDLARVQVAQLAQQVKALQEKQVEMQQQLDFQAVTITSLKELVAGLRGHNE